MSESFAARARKTAWLATGIVCQDLPESNDRCKAPSAEIVQRCVDGVPWLRSCILRETCGDATRPAPELFWTFLSDSSFALATAACAVSTGGASACTATVSLMPLA